jgi:hypothetical protein
MADEKSPPENKDNVYNCQWYSTLVGVAGVSSALLAVATLCLFIPMEWELSKGWCQVLYAFWGLLPATYFFFESGWILNWNYKDYQQRKHVQDTARAFWVAFLSAFALLYTAKFGIPLKP